MTNRAEFERLLDVYGFRCERFGQDLSTHARAQVVSAFAALASTEDWPTPAQEREAERQWDAWAYEMNQCHNAALEKAAAWVDKRRQDFDHEHGYMEAGTGAWSFGTGTHAEAKAEYSAELGEIAEHIRALKQPQADKDGGQHRARDAYEALSWYAEQVAGCRKFGPDGEAARHALDRDGGERARAALSATQPEQGERDA